jgi:hypothetical protein
MELIDSKTKHLIRKDNYLKFIRKINIKNNKQ